MYNIIPLVIILICLAVILLIIVKKMPLLAAFDVNSIPEVKAEETKQKIMEKRIERKIRIYYNKIAPFFKLIANFLARKIKGIQDKLKVIEEKYKAKTKKEVLVTKEEFESLENKIGKLLKEADDLAGKDEFAEAEKKYLEILSFDSRNVTAYRGLGHLYIQQKNYQEAKQIFEHILKLNNLDDEAYAYLGKIAEEEGDFAKAKEDFLRSVDIKSGAINLFELAEVCFKMKNFDEAIDYLNKAREFEPNNPKYLDLLLTISIIIKNKGLAKETLAKFKEINPENAKIEDFEAQIKEL